MTRSVEKRVVGVQTTYSIRACCVGRRKLAFSFFRYGLHTGKPLAIGYLVCYLQAGALLALGPFISLT